MNSILILLLAYFCGAIPTGYWVVKALKQVDLTRVGSGGTGATNVLRTAGKGAAAFVLFVDVAKGLISTSSPIGRGLLGKIVGDTVKIQIPGGVREMEVIKLTTIHDSGS